MFAIVKLFTFVGFFHIIITKDLDKSCTSHSDCLTAFSYCVQNRCICMDEFPRTGDQCKPSVYNCPTKDPYKENGKVKLCKTPSSDPHICPEGYFCFSHGYEFVDKNSNITHGHCCHVPRSKLPPRPICPLGTTNEVAKCGFSTHEQVCIDEETFNCIDIAGFDKTSCCAIPCPSVSGINRLNFKVVNGTCERFP